MDYLTLQQYRYQKQNAILDDYKIGYYNKDKYHFDTKNIIKHALKVNQKQKIILSSFAIIDRKTKSGKSNETYQ